jgi:hypothetical protein
MHRLLLGLVDGFAQVDHRNGNGLDNRRGNLRIATASQNQWNQKVRGRGTSKYKGVAWEKRGGKWVVKIAYLGRRIHLGSFARNVINGIDYGEIKAARAYDLAAVKFFGVFARLNLGDKDMGYVISKKEVAKANKLIKILNGCEFTTINQWLMSRSVEELEILCRFVGCNISGLAGGLRTYSHHVMGAKPYKDEEVFGEVKGADNASNEQSRGTGNSEPAGSSETVSGGKLRTGKKAASAKKVPVSNAV